MTLREKIETMEAFERGEEIEISNSLGETWIQEPRPNWNWVKCTYRIKPKPKKVVVIEKWLLEGKQCYSVDKNTYLHIVETSNIDAYIKAWGDYKKVELLDTYEIELWPISTKNKRTKDAKYYKRTFKCMLNY